MAAITPVVQTVTLENGSLTATVDLRQGLDNGRVNSFPENCVVMHQGNSLIDGSETLDIQGYGIGYTTVITAVLTTQITLAASTVVRTDLTSVIGGVHKLLFTADALTAGEEVSITVLTW